MTTTAFRNRGMFRASKAGQYLQQLCKHFAHKADVQRDASSGTVTFSIGHVEMIATDDHLDFVVEAQAVEDLKRVQTIVEDHLLRFAFREEAKHIDWLNDRG